VPPGVSSGYNSPLGGGSPLGGASPLGRPTPQGGASPLGGGTPLGTNPFGGDQKPDQNGGENGPPDSEGN
jgi:hypothetical protein